MTTRSIRTLVLGAVGALLMGVSPPMAGAVPPEPTARAAGPSINDVSAFDAPIGRKGGFQNAFVMCANYRVEPRAVMRVRNRETGWTRTFRWTGALPGLFFPRVEPGTYVARTTVTCGAVEARRREKFVIAEKTLDGTMSREEFDAIETGMTRAEVAAIVGNPGRDPYTSAGTTQVTYDNMRFWAWSTVTFRNGRVTDSYWQVPHD